MAFDLKAYATDKTREIEGSWEEIAEGTRLLVARVNNPEYLKRYRRIPRAIRQQIQNGLMGDEQTDAVICRMLADTILLDWEGLSDEGRTLSYSKEKAYEMLRKYPDFRELVWGMANDMSRFKAEDAKETEKNLSSDFDGS